MIKKLTKHFFNATIKQAALKEKGVSCMCFRRKLMLRFILIFFILIPGICADSLFLNDLTGITHYGFTFNSSLDASDHSKDQYATDTNESIDNVNYRLFSLCITDTLNSSETFQISQLINRSQNQSRGFKYSLFFISLFMLTGYSLLNTEYLYIMIKCLKKSVIIYIHKSDGKKKLLFS